MDCGGWCCRLFASLLEIILLQGYDESTGRAHLHLVSGKQRGLKSVSLSLPVPSSSDVHLIARGDELHVTSGTGTLRMSEQA